ncbi:MULTISPECIES: DUF1036 domain-containing protein [unclassified Mesorhizobium]|uniref:DUF1036 domain-containing protein n=2 Tax=unclassified Mesorhizobium TaxID=325217 RepID=UPI001CCD96BC|nr:MULTISPECIES: DUF1036 domain-containing protein [unclassified Mesorhizobium]MBZ9896159.1 DUF1036 domain-containing protein [Mesorhizobium sp. BR1-1-6]MBZ9983437.1 DUF1036 domain-containing protein [Mesorhizobium sp. BR-1-1-8]MCA0008905.1 DUF1036 domain-containing protein [Mesorhizobium sp. B264B1B]MCA0017098.1 DUF1036 domain-containing protein [Mesorhizobium sp. B264B1A]
MFDRLVCPARKAAGPVPALSAPRARMKLAIILGAPLALLLSSQARAEFTVCNQTLDVVNLAVGQKVDNADQTDGWWTIGANQCVNVIREELTNRYVYIYATDVFGHAILAGLTEMCIERRRFSIRGSDECWQRGHITARFLEVDTLEQVRWTFFLTASNP